jgi:hypothetical protein
MLDWMRRRREEKQASMVGAMAQAFATALGGVLQAQTAQIQQQTQFLGTLQDLSARKASQVLGSRGGRKTAERKAARKRAEAAAPVCRLCHNPNVRGVQLWEIDAHRQHEAMALPPPAEGPPVEVGN